MPTIALTASYVPTVAASQLRPTDGTETAKRRIADFNRGGWAPLRGDLDAGPVR
jgi:hypothetical protein